MLKKPIKCKGPSFVLFSVISWIVSLAQKNDPRNPQHRTKFIQSFLISDGINLMVAGCVR
jgi:hypothetical protein